MMSLRKKRSGFTMVEIIVVLVIVLIFSTFAIMSYTSYRKHAMLRNSVKRLESTFKTARALAINQNSRHQVQIDITNNTFWIDQVSRTGEIVKPKVMGTFWLPDDVFISDVRKGSTTYSSGIVTVEFTSSSTAEYATVHIIGRQMDASVNENYYSIRVYPSTGLTHTYKNEWK